MPHDPVPPVNQLIDALRQIHQIAVEAENGQNPLADVTEDQVRLGIIAALIDRLLGLRR